MHDPKDLDPEPRSNAPRLEPVASVLVSFYFGVYQTKLGGGGVSACFVGSLWGSGFQIASFSFGSFGF